MIQPEINHSTSFKEQPAAPTSPATDRKTKLLTFRHFFATQLLEDG